ncbi:uncharacterized protein ACB057_012439 [Neosynchiropus ocellatus]
MACIPFQTQLSSIMEVLVKAAVAEISKLVDDKCAFLHLEISRKQSENEQLKRKLQLMEERHAPQQRSFENYAEGGSDGGTCLDPAGEVKFPELEDATVSFTIKEESPDEALWISDSAEPGALQLHPPGIAEESRPYQPDHRLGVAEPPQQKASGFSESFHSALQVGGLRLTVKTEKDVERSGFGQEGCQHAAAKASNALPDFSLDDRENQLWSSIIEGNELDAGYPDFSSVVDEYSGSYPDQPGVASGAAKPSCQRQSNGGYDSEFPKDVQSSGFQPRPPADPCEPDRGMELHAEERLESEATAREHVFKPSPRGYLCSLCGKSFARLTQFKMHQQTHKRKRAFWCTVCGKNFQCLSHLSIHHRTHTGEKPYVCGECGKRFTQQSSLRVHQRTHSGERPYSCGQCGKTFILMHHLKRHRIIHTYS